MREAAHARRSDGVKAVTIDRSGPEALLRIEDITEPTRGHGQALIEVHTSSVNRADLAMLSGTYDYDKR